MRMTSVGTFMKRGVLSALLLMVLGVPFAVFADPVIRTGQSVSVEKGQVVEGDLYTVGGMITVSGEVQGDAYMAGGSVTLNAPVDADVALIGGTVQVHSPVGDDFRVIGGEVTLGEAVADDVVVIGGTLKILSTAKVGGDIIFFGDTLIIEGPVTGSVYGTSERVEIDSAIGGNIDMRATKEFRLGDKADIKGNISYRGNEEILRGQNAVVVGNIQQEKLPIEQVSFEALLIPVFMALFAALTMFFLARRPLTAIVEKTHVSYGMQGLVGLAMFVAVPFVALVLMVSVLGIIAGVFLLASYVALVVASWVIGAIILGSFIMRFAMKDREVNLVSVIVGVVAFQILLLVPFVGFLAGFALMAIALGGISMRLYRVFR